MAFKKSVYKNIAGIAFVSLMTLFIFWLWIVVRGFSYNNGQDGLIEYKLFYSYEQLRSLISSYGDAGAAYYVFHLICEFLMIAAFTVCSYGTVRFLFYDRLNQRKYGVMVPLILGVIVDIIEKIMVIIVLSAHPSDYYISYLVLQAMTVLKFFFHGVAILLYLGRGYVLIHKSLNGY